MKTWILQGRRKLAGNLTAFASVTGIVEVSWLVILFLAHLVNPPCCVTPQSSPCSFPCVQICMNVEEGDQVEEESLGILLQQCSWCGLLVPVTLKPLGSCTPHPEGWREESPSRSGLHAIQGRRSGAFCGVAAQLRPCTTRVALHTEPALRRQVLANLFAYLPFSVCTAWINTLCRNHELICIHCSDYLRFCWWSQPAKCCFLAPFWPVSQRREHVFRPW